MFAKLFSRRRSRKPLRRKSNVRFPEQLEGRLLLAGDVLEFDTALTSLNLSGGPYPMPLASDPGNLLGDSVMGYGFVDAEVTITLSSQRAVDPGPPSLGTACAFPGGIGTANVQRGCFDEYGGGGAPAPIDPNELDGQEFLVDSFFDVFFDITVTDVDDRPGRDFAGMPDGASILLPDNGPAHMQSFYSVIFDKDAPNFGLIPPPEVAPYIGHFNIEIPLGGDINGNANPDGTCVADPGLVCNDKIKFTIASHAAGDENRTFTTLPDGTVIDGFDSAAFLAGAVVDESTDPDFTLGVNLGSPDFPQPAFDGPGALTGPTTATSKLLNPLVTGESDLSIDKTAVFDPASATLVYTVTVDNLGPDDADNVVVTDTLPTDVTLVSTTGCAEDPAGVPTCSLGTITAGSFAQYTITVTVNAGAAEVVTNEASVISDNSDPDDSNNSVALDTVVKLADPGGSFVDANNDGLFLLSDGDVLLTAGELADGLFDTQVPEGGYATVISGAGLVVNGDPIVAPNIDFRADGNLVVNTDLTATGSVPTRRDRHGDRHGHRRGGSDGGSDGGGDRGGDISLSSRTLDVNVSGQTLTALREIELTAAGNIDVAGATLGAGTSVELQAEGNVDGDKATVIDAGGDVEIQAGRNVLLDGASITAGREAEIEAGGSLSVVLATIDGRDVELEAGGKIAADNATITAGKEIEIESGGSVSLQGSVLRARREIEIEALDAIFAAMADISAGREIEIEAGGNVDLTDALLVAGRKIDITGATVDQTGATLTARRVRIRETA